MRRAVTAVITVLVVAAVVLLVVRWQADDQVSPPNSDPSDPAATASVRPHRPADAQPMTVRYVYDGDTLQLQAAEPGTHVTTTAKIRVRLVGVDAPETTPTPECFAQQATDRLRRLAAVRSTVWVAPDRDSWDDYGRRLFLVWTADGRLIDEELIADGFGTALRIRPNVTYWPRFEAAQQKAQRERRGLWGAC